MTDSPNPKQRGQRPRELTTQSTEREWQKVGRDAARELRRLLNRQRRLLTFKERH
jgi:hypothetical protein